MKDYGIRGFIIAFTLFFILTFGGCYSSWTWRDYDSGQETTDYFPLTFSAIFVGGILGGVGLLIGKQFKKKK